MDDAHALLARVNADALYPPFRALLERILTSLAERGLIYVVTSGERTWDEQRALYAKGRTVAPIGKAHIVTKADAGYSPHNFAVAADCTRHALASYDGKLRPDYRDAAYKALADGAKELDLDPGLYWPGNFQDAPHVQLPLRQRGITWAKLREVYGTGGKVAVFTFLDEKGPWGPKS